MSSFARKIIIFLLVFVALLLTAATFAINVQDSDTSVQDSTLRSLRLHTIQTLITSGFDRFVTMPLGPGSDFFHLTWSQDYPEYPDFYLTTGMNVQDDLDILLVKKIEDLYQHRWWFGKFSSPSFDDILLDSGDIQQLQTVYLFKTEQDLKDLWYVVSSFRTRINKDPTWRQANIFNSYRNIGNVRVLNPDQELKFMDEIHYDPTAGDHKRDLASGMANVGGLNMVKWWGICGAGWGVHSTILPNKAFEILERHPHTISYNYLYEHTVNGQHYRIPGLDTSVYSFSYGKKDFIIKNIREYPIVLVINYDGSDGGLEEWFVLSKEQDRGYLKYIGNEGNCYTREANGKQLRSCYSKVVK